MCAYVPLQVEGVIEALTAEGAQVPLYLVVALKVTVEHALQAEALTTQVTVVNHRVVARAGGKLGAERECVRSQGLTWESRRLFSLSWAWLWFLLPLRCMWAWLWGRCDDTGTGKCFCTFFLSPSSRLSDSYLCTVLQQPFNKTA